MMQSVMGLSEVELLQAAWEGSRGAWRRLVEDHYPAVLALARRMLGSESEARDAAQEAFARAFEHIREFDAARRFAAWVMTIAANHVRDLLRRRRGVALDLEMEEACAAFVPPDARMLREENCAAVRSAMDRLPPDLKIVVHLVFEQELSHAEIAAALGVSVNAVRIRLYRALGILRKGLS